MTVHDHVMATVNMMAAEADLDEDAFVSRLIDMGCSQLQAQLLVLLVPLALGRSIIAGRQRMPSEMPEAAAFPTRGRIYYVRLTAIPEFAAALAAAGSTIPADKVTAVGARGSELQAIQAAVEAGQDLTQSQMSAPFLVGVAGAPGFVKWFEGFGPQDREVEETEPIHRPAKRPWWQIW